MNTPMDHTMDHTMHGTEHVHPTGGMTHPPGHGDGGHDGMMVRKLS